MDNGKVLIYYGLGHGKTGAAIGEALHMAGTGKTGVVIQFLKGRQEQEKENNYLQRLEPELKLFSFAKKDCGYFGLSLAEQKEEGRNQKNGFNYSRKVISTGGCDVIVLDEILGLIDLGIITENELKEALDMRPEEMTVILTGRKLPKKVRTLADEVYNISKE